MSPSRTGLHPRTRPGGTHCPRTARKYLIDHCPDDIRHLDGLPAAARDQANRNALEGYVDANGKKHQGALKDAEQALEQAQLAYDIADKKQANN